MGSGSSKLAQPPQNQRQGGSTNRKKVAATVKQQSVAKESHDSKPENPLAKLERNAVGSHSNRRLGRRKSPRAGIAATRDSVSVRSTEERIMQAMQRLRWKVGGEHKLFDHLKDEAGFVSAEKLQPLLRDHRAQQPRNPLQDDGGANVADAVKWLDADGDGKVSKKDLEAQVVGKLFEEQVVSLTARCGEELLESFAKQIPVSMRGKPAAHTLAEMSDTDLDRCAAEAWRSFGASMRKLRDELKTLKEQNTNESGAASKYAFKAADGSGNEFLFGNLSMFAEGLDKLIGLPATTNVAPAMEREHQSRDLFETSNYSTTTFDKQEYDLVANKKDVDYPFHAARVRRDVDALMMKFESDEVCLTREEVVALVLYTGPLYEKYNKTLREVLFPIAKRLQDGQKVELDLKEVPYLTTIHMLVSGVLKLSKQRSLEGGRVVYRGLKGKLLPDFMTKEDEWGCRGGTDLGMMSTTADVSVAKEYADLESGDWPTIFEIETGQVDRGASLSALSQYPEEAEILLPPLCYLEVTGEPQVVWEGDLAYWKVPMRLNVNLKSSTREQHEERRHLEVLSAANAALLDTKAALYERLRDETKTNPNCGTELVAWLLDEGKTVRKRLQEQGATASNDDRKFRRALQDWIDYRAYSLETMDAFCHDPLNQPASYFKAFSMLTFHRRREGDAREAYARAIESTEAAARTTAAKELAVLEGHLEKDDPESKSGLDMETALIRTAAAGDEERLGVLADARCDVNAKSDSKCTALLAAVLVGQDGAVKKLLELRADPEASNFGDDGWTVMRQAAQDGRERCLKVLIAGGANASATDAYGWTPILAAAAFGHLQCMVLLKEAGGDIHAADIDGVQPIHAAAATGRVEIVQWMKQARADIRAADDDGGQPIHLATAEATIRLKHTKRLKAAGADVRAADNDGVQPIQIGVTDGYVKCVEWLQKAGANVRAANNDGRQPIHLAAANGEVKCVEWLQRAGADVRAPDIDGVQPIHLAALNGHVECMAWLQKAGADICVPDNNGGQPIHWAAANGHVKCMEWLQMAGANVRAANNDGRQPIHLAAANGEVKCVEWLQKAGANVRAPDIDGGQPIYWAALNGHVECMKVLQKAGADIRAANNDGAQPIHLAAGNGDVECVEWIQKAGTDVRAADKDGAQPMHWAAVNGHEECMEWLTKAGADICVPDNNGGQPIHVAAQHGHVECMEWLQKAGADVRAADNNGWQPIHEAAANGHVECMAWLTKAGADIRAADNDGDKPIHKAAQNGHVECVEWLQKAGEDVNAVNKDGRTALDLAKEEGHVECALYLEEADSVVVVGDVGKEARGGRGAEGRRRRQEETAARQPSSVERARGGRKEAKGGRDRPLQQQRSGLPARGVGRAEFGARKGGLDLAD